MLSVRFEVFDPLLNRTHRACRGQKRFQYEPVEFNEELECVIALDAKPLWKAFWRVRQYEWLNGESLAAA